MVTTASDRIGLQLIISVHHVFTDEPENNHNYSFMKTQ